MNPIGALERAGVPDGVRLGLPGDADRSVGGRAGRRAPPRPRGADARCARRSAHTRAEAGARPGSTTPARSRSGAGRARGRLGLPARGLDPEVPDLPDLAPDHPLPFLRHAVGGRATRRRGTMTPPGSTSTRPTYAGPASSPAGWAGRSCGSPSSTPPSRSSGPRCGWPASRGADPEGTPWVTAWSTPCARDVGLEHGAGLPVWDALARGEAEDLRTLAQKAAAGSVALPACPRAGPRPRPGRARARRWGRACAGSTRAAGSGTGWSRGRATHRASPGST